MGNIKVTPRSLTDAYKRREGDFAPNLVGLQFTNGESLFTFGNFQITTNLNPRLAKDFMLGGEWSEYYSLNNLNLTQEESEQLLSNNINVKINFNPKNIDRFVYFGSFYELVKVTLEQIIQKWKGSLYVNPFNNTNIVLNTILSLNYDSGQDVTTFLIPTESVSNAFELVIESQTLVPVTTSPGEIYNVNESYTSYVIWNPSINKKTPVIAFTGSSASYPYLTVKTKGNPFTNLTGSTFGQTAYHMMPKDNEVNLFFQQLTDFEKILLNNLTTPVYTSRFKTPIDVDGTIVFYERSFTWPSTDGYNIDINTFAYRTYVQNILEMSNDFDKYKTDLITRRFVSESIQEYDTDGDGTDIYGRKVKKLLRIYGREFDEVKKYINGISFANVVTYNKLDNTSDELIRIMAKNLGFDFFLTTTNNNFNLLQQLETDSQPVFSGYSRNLSAKELETELWRRLIINAWWLYKSKGTRKVIEFFFKLFKVPECMVSLNEYIYVAKDRLDTFEVVSELAKIYNVDLDTINLSGLPMDDYGFPRTLTKTNDNYFQQNGFWYNGGSESTLGNNPHIGPYDFGKNYFEQFECFVDNINDYITGSTLVTVYENSFNNYNNGTFIFDQNGLPVQYYGTAYADSLNNNNLVQNAIVNYAGLTYVGGNNSPIYGRPSGDTYSMKINFTAGKGKVCDIDCDYDLKYGDDGVIYIVGTPNKPLTDRNCCNNYWLPSSNPRGEVKTETDFTFVSLKQFQTELGGVPRLTAVDTKSQYYCYWCPPDDNINTICNSTDYVDTLSSQNITNLATSLGWTTTQNITAKSYLETSLSGYFTTNCLILDYDNKAIANKPCCELKGGTWSFNSQTNSYTCTLNKTNPCSDISVNSYHILVDSNGNNATTECCTNLGKQYTSGFISVYENNSYYNTIRDDVGLYGAVNSFVPQKSYCTDCPTAINIVGGYVYDYLSNLDLTSKCCTDYGFSYSTLRGKCSKCPITTVNQSQSDGSTVILSETNTNLSEVCCDNIGGWYGVSSLSPTTNKCYLCAPSTDGGYTFSVNSTYTELQFNGLSLTQSCCLYYQTSVGGGIQWDPNLNKCLANSGSGGNTTSNGTNYNLKLGNSWCGLVGTGSVNVNEALINVSYPLPNINDAPSHISGVVNALYTPLGETPLTSPIYMNVGLTTLLTPKTLLNYPSNSAFYNVINYTGPANFTGILDKHYIVFEYPLTNSIYLLDFTNNAIYTNNVLTGYVFDIVNPYPIPSLLSSQIGGTC